MKTGPIRVLIVEDSAVSVALMRSILEDAPDIEVIGLANDGLMALQLTRTLKPDLITMDIMMPRMDGLEATRLIMQQYPTPIIVFSAHTNEYDQTYSMRALNEGALAIIEKPKLTPPNEFAEKKRYILQTIRALADAPVVRRKKSANSMSSLPAYSSPYQLLALGASTGGPQALQTILKSLPKDFPIPIVIGQHISEGFLKGLVMWLQEHCTLKLAIAQDGQVLLPGHVYFCDEHFHLTITKSDAGPIAHLDNTAPYQHFKPSITLLFASIAKSYPAQAIAGLLTGMGRDGAEGLLEMKTMGCYTFAQSKEGCLVYGMPRVAKEIKAIEKMIDLKQIPSQLAKLIMKER